MSSADDKPATEPMSAIRSIYCNPEVRRLLDRQPFVRLPRELPASLSERLDRLERAERTHDKVRR